MTGGYNHPYLERIKKPEKKPAQSPRPINVQVAKFTNFHVPKSTSVRLPKSTSVRLPKSIDVQIPRHVNVQLPRPTHLQQLNVNRGSQPSTRNKLRPPKPPEKSRVQAKNEAVRVLPLPNQHKHSLGEAVFPPGMVQIPADVELKPLRIPQIDPSANILPILECNLRKAPSSPNHFHIKWMFSSSPPIRSDLNFEMDSKRTYAGCFDNFETFLQQVVNGLVCLQLRGVQFDPSNLRLYASQNGDAFVAPHNLFLLADPAEANKFFQVYRLASAVQDYNKDQQVNQITEASVGRLLLKLICLEGDLFEELQNNSSMLMDYVDKITDLHHKNLKVKTSASFIRTVLDIVLKYSSILSQQDQVDFPQLQDSLRLGSPKEQKLTSPWVDNNRDVFQLGYAIVPPPIGMTCQYLASKSVEPKYKVVGKSSLPQEKQTFSRQPHEDPSRRLPQPLKISKQKLVFEPAPKGPQLLIQNRQESAKRLTRSISEPDPISLATANTQFEQKLLILSQVVDFEQTFLDMLRQTSKEGFLTLADVPKEPRLAPLMENVAFCAAFGCAKLIRVSHLLSCRTKYLTYYPVTELPSQIASICKDVFKDWLDRNATYKRLCTSLTSELPTFKQSLYQLHGDVMRNFNASNQKTLLDNLCKQKTEVQLTMLPLSRINDELAVSLLSVVKIINTENFNRMNLSPELTKSLKLTVARHSFLLELEKASPITLNKHGNEKTQIENLQLDELKKAISDPNMLEEIYKNAAQKVQETTLSRTNEIKNPKPTDSEPLPPFSRYPPQIIVHHGNRMR